MALAGSAFVPTAALSFGGAPCGHTAVTRPISDLARRRGLRWCAHCKRYVRGETFTLTFGGHSMTSTSWHVADTPLP